MAQTELTLQFFKFFLKFDHTCFCLVGDMLFCNTLSQNTLTLCLIFSPWYVNDSLSHLCFFEAQYTIRSKHMVTNSPQLTCWACSDRSLPVDLSCSCCWWWLWFVYKTFPIFRTHLIKPFLQHLEKKQLKVTKCFDIKKMVEKKNKQ